MSKPDELEARTADGVTLRLDRVAARGERRGVVVCLHAMMTDGRYFGARRDTGFAQLLADAGLDVYVADFRGHGRSVPPHAGKDDWSFDDLVEHDLPTILTTVAVTSQVPTSSVAIVGHSLGGLVTCAALGTKRIEPPRVLGLAATSVWLGDTVQRRAIMTAYRGVTALFGKAPIRALRAGTADESATYVKQLTGWSSSGRWTSLAGVDYMVALETITTPVFAFTGAGDWMCKPDDANAIAKRIRSCEPLRVVGKKHGDTLDPDHFTLFTRPELTTLRREIADRLVAS
ncbi:MAG TPA: alpha/beta fold hydrolase [Kofleriaceae bacterium]|nr:alpha/beta fold hydrolase [Kofleriaceae bacterium]